MGFGAVGDWQFCRGKDAPDLGFDEVAQALTTPRAAAYRFHNVVGGVHTDVSHEQELFEGVERLDVDGSRSLLGRIGALNQGLELRGELLRRAGKAGFETIEETH